VNLQLQPASAATHKGQRSYQEDRLFTASMQEGFLVAVFDGHGGAQVSHLASERFPVLFINEITEPGTTPRQAFERSIEKLNIETQHFGPGSTLSAVFIPSKGDTATCAVIGDSPIVIKDAEGKTNIGPEHNVRTNLAEAEAAKKRGGFVGGGYLYATYHGDGLQMARALGDSALSKVLSRVPDIYEVKLGNGSFVVVATDGAFDPGHYEFHKAAEAVVELVEKGGDAAAIVDRAVKIPTGDNVTAIVVRCDAAPKKARKPRAKK
jgi:serine/threonine protein phosphatase PrpC